MKKRIIISSLSLLQAVTENVKELKSEDVKDRKKVKPRLKPAYTKRIAKASEVLKKLNTAKVLIRAMNKRVA